MKTKTTTKLLKCPKCKHTDGLRIKVEQDVDVTINNEGFIEAGNDFSMPEMETDTGEVYCSKCDMYLDLKFDDKTKKQYLAISSLYV